MKRIILLPAIVCLALLTACEGPMGPPGPEGPSGPGTEWYSDTYTITSTMWEIVRTANEEGSYFQRVVDVPAITDNVLKYGAITAYLVDGDFQSPLPYTVYRLDEQDPSYQYQEQFTFDIARGQIVFVLMVSDYLTGYTMLPTCTFRLSMMW